MLKKAWEGIALLVLVIIAVNLIASSVKPFLPILGLVVIGIVGAWLVKLVFFRRKF